MNRRRRLKSAKNSPVVGFGTKMILGIFVFAVVLIGGEVAIQQELGADSTGQITPPIFVESVDDCNLGLIGSCNDNGDYVTGPESILDTWLFSTAVPWWISFLLSLAAGVAVLILMIGGGMFLVAGENTELRGKGVNAITWALVGLLIALFAFTIVAILENLPLPGSTTPTETTETT